MSYARRCLLELLGPAGDEDDLIGQVEDDRAHAEAERIREEAKATADSWTSEANRSQAERSSGAMYYVADLVDPYEMRDGQLVRKSDGKPVTL